MRGFFAPDAVICWHCTDEEFTLEEYIRANCECPVPLGAAHIRLEQCQKNRARSELERARLVIPR